jgi:hypothetical protein
MAHIAKRLDVVEVQPKLGSDVDPDLVIHVKVPFAFRETAAEVFEDYFVRGKPNANLATLTNDIWFPTAGDTAPGISFEALRPHSAVVCAVASLGGLPSELVVGLLLGFRMEIAATGRDESRAAWLQAGAFRKLWHAVERATSKSDPPTPGLPLLQTPEWSQISRDLPGCPWQSSLSTALG